MFSIGKLLYLSLPAYPVMG